MVEVRAAGWHGRQKALDVPSDTGTGAGFRGSLALPSGHHWEGFRATRIS